MKLWMQKIKWWPNKHITTSEEHQSPYSYTAEKPRLINEIRKAHKEWQVAVERMDCVVEFDEIDYAIYALEAAQKRYEMLLRQGKLLKINVLEAGRMER